MPLPTARAAAPATLFMTHRRRVRLSELVQALRSGREREPFGILWDGRHATVDLEIMLLDASAQSPVSIVYMDMNGLKQLNDTHGHDAGNRGLRAYFEAVSAALADVGQAYRLGGDEVLALLPGRDRAAASPDHRDSLSSPDKRAPRTLRGNHVVDRRWSR